MPRGKGNTPESQAKMLANLIPKKKGECSNPNGRPRKTITTVLADLKEKGVKIPTAREVSEIFITIATMQEDELKSMLSDKEQPMMNRIIAKNILDKRGLDVIERLIERAYGRTEQRIDITTNGKDLKPDPITIRFVGNNAEYEKIKQEIEDERARKEAEENNGEELS